MCSPLCGRYLHQRSECKRKWRYGGIFRKSMVKVRWRGSKRFTSHIPGGYKRDPALAITVCRCWWMRLRSQGSTTTSACCLMTACVERELYASYFSYGKDVMQIIDLEHPSCQCRVWPQWYCSGWPISAIFFPTFPATRFPWLKWKERLHLCWGTQ